MALGSASMHEPTSLHRILDIVYLDSSRSERPQSGPKDMGLKRALDNQNENGLELL